MTDQDDPQRWSEVLAGDTPDAGRGAAFRAAAAAHGHDERAAANVLARLDHAGPRRQRRWPLALAGGLLVTVSGAVAASTSLLIAREREPAIVTVPDGQTVRWQRRHRKLAITGPAALRISSDPARPIVTSGGVLKVEETDTVMEVAGPGLQVELSPGAIADLDFRAAGEPLIATRAATVAIRRPGAPPVVVHAGETWPPPSMPAPPMTSSPGVGAMPALPPRATSGQPPAETAPATPVPAAADVAVPRPHRVAVQPPQPPPAPPPVQPSSVENPPLAVREDAQTLAEAFRLIRRAGEPGLALELLERHAPELRAGSLSGEASVARAEALVALGRRADALAILETMSLSGSGVDRPLLVARGELRAEAGRCQTSLSDFTMVIGADRRDGFEERALQGRATCRLRLGDAPAARSDLERYLVLYPAGRFAAETRRAMGQAAGAP